MDGEEIKIKMDDGVARFFTRFFFSSFFLFSCLYLLTCGRRSLVSGTRNDILVS